MRKFLPLRPGSLPPNSVQNVVFVTRPKLNLMEDIAQNLYQYDCFSHNHVDISFSLVSFLAEIYVIGTQYVKCQLLC